jgi:hypothetical protein
MKAVCPRIGPLAQLVTQLYGAELYLTVVQADWRKPPRRAYVFLSDLPGTVELCNYAMTVLARQLTRDCNTYLRHVKSAKNRAARGDVFGLSWVIGLRKALGLKIDEDTMPVVSAAVTQHMASLGLAKGPVVKARESKAVSHNDHMAGYESGQKAQLNKAVKRDHVALEKLA